MERVKHQAWIGKVGRRLTGSGNPTGPVLWQARCDCGHRGPDLPREAAQADAYRHFREAE